MTGTRSRALGAMASFGQLPSSRTAKKMSDVRKPDFGHAGQIAPRVAIVRSPHTEKLAFPPDPQRFPLEARLLLHEL